MILQTIQTYFGVSIRYDGEDTAHIQVPFDYWNATCGLCGTFDDDRDNDFRLPDGTKVSDCRILRMGLILGEMGLVCRNRKYIVTCINQFLLNVPCKNER